MSAGAPARTLALKGDAMSLLSFAQETVVTIDPEATVEAAAKLMRARNVGCVVVVRGRKPVGVLTDRDIALRVVAAGGNPKLELVASVMSKPPITLPEELGLFEALETIKRQGIRRFPVVDPEGNLSGIFTLDDVLYLLGLELSAISHIVERASR